MNASGSRSEGIIGCAAGSGKASSVNLGSVQAPNSRAQVASGSHVSLAAKQTAKLTGTLGTGAAIAALVGSAVLGPEAPPIVATVEFAGTMGLASTANLGTAAVLEPNQENVTNALASGLLSAMGEGLTSTMPRTSPGLAGLTGEAASLVCEAGPADSAAAAVTNAVMGQSRPLIITTKEAEPGP
jgi:hypothetical protein